MSDDLQYLMLNRALKDVEYNLRMLRDRHDNALVDLDKRLLEIERFIKEVRSAYDARDTWPDRNDPTSSGLTRNFGGGEEGLGEGGSGPGPGGSGKGNRSS